MQDVAQIEFFFYKEKITARFNGKFPAADLNKALYLLSWLHIQFNFLFFSVIFCY